MSYLDKLKDEFLTIVESDTTDEYFVGFSERLHYFLDQVEEIEVPKRINRPTFLTKITGSSRGAARSWLQLDQTPRGRYLLYLVDFFLRYIPSAKNFSTIEVETWLKYGESFINNPFDQIDDAQHALAEKVILKTAEKMNIDVNDFNLSKTIPDITAIFKANQISVEKDVTQTISAQIILYIGKHSFKKNAEPC